MIYDSAVQYLFSLQQFGFKPGLDSTRRLARRVGNLQEQLRFIHVAGTNGKGSVCAMLESVYRCSGRQVGLYTSPHLVRFGERIQINRVNIPDADLARLTGILKDALEEENRSSSVPLLTPTFFEFTTVVAMMWFAENVVDLVVWETGLGGRWDATNIVTPLVSVITNIGLDHQKVLGSTTAAIASEKAGIIKPDIPILTATEDLDARQIIEYRARELSAPFLYISPSDVTNFRHPLGLLGGHQRINGALAAATIRILRAQLPVSDEQMVRGLAEVKWPGRLQRIQRGKQVLLLDGAHNRAGIETLRTALAENYCGQHPTLILGMLADKDWAEMVGRLAPMAGRIIAAPVNSPRTVAAEDLRGAVLKSGAARPVKAVGSLSEALKVAGNDPFVVITGSLYLVGEALGLLDPDGFGQPAVVELRLNDWKPPEKKSSSGGP